MQRGASARLRSSAINASRLQNTQTQAADWRRDLRSKIAWTLVAKGLGLTLLWLLFFRGHAP